MAETLRLATAADAGPCGRICFEAFASICDAHNFPRDFPYSKIAAGLLGGMISHPGFYGVVAERDGTSSASTFSMNGRRSLGSVRLHLSPMAQNKGIGRALMQNVIDRGHSLGAPGIRLLQAAYHGRSFSLYTSLGFHTREPLSVLQGKPLDLRFAGYDVRLATETDAGSAK